MLETLDWKPLINWERLRHGDIWKTVAAKVVEAKNISGMRQMSMTAAEVNPVVNEQNRTGGYSPAQLVIGRTPRYGMAERGSDELAGNVGGLEERVDPTTIFAERMELRQAAKKAYVHADSSKKIAKALLRKTAPKIADYRVGDLVSFLREQNSKGERRRRWSPSSFSFRVLFT